MPGAPSFDMLLHDIDNLKGTASSETGPSPADLFVTFSWRSALSRHETGNKSSMLAWQGVLRTCHALAVTRRIRDRDRHGSPHPEACRLCPTSRHFAPARPPCLTWSAARQTCACFYARKRSCALFSSRAF